MRVALIAPLVTPITARHVGGAQAVVSDLARALAGRGHDVVVYASRGSAIAGVTVVDAGVESAALSADAFRAGTDSAPSAAMTAAYEAVYAHVAAARFDVVHNHGFDAPAVGVAAARGVAVLHTLHLPPTPSLAAALDSARRGTTPVWCAAVSRSHHDAWARLVRVDAVLRNGVPVDDIPFAAQGNGAALLAARCSAEKGIDDGIGAARQAGWNVDVYATPYDADYERQVRARWAHDDAVRWHPPVAREALWTALGSASAVLCLSRWEEPFGMVAAEAQAAGTPVIASRAGGLAEIVRDGVTGFLVPEGDVAAAARALHEVGWVSRDGCRRHAHAALDLRDTVVAHETLYARLVASS